MRIRVACDVRYKQEQQCGSAELGLHCRGDRLVKWTGIPCEGTHVLSSDVGSERCSCLAERDLDRYPILRHHTSADCRTNRGQHPALPSPQVSHYLSSSVCSCDVLISLRDLQLGCSAHALYMLTSITRTSFLSPGTVLASRYGMTSHARLMVTFHFFHFSFFSLGAGLTCHAP